MNIKTFGWVLLVLLLVVSGCNTPAAGGVPDSSKTYSRTIFTYDGAGQPVAKFVFEQTSSDTASSVNLKIQNIRDIPVCVIYTVFFRLNFVAWEYQGDVRNLPVGGVLDVGTISSNRARVDLGAFWVRFSTPATSRC